jgi:hypothetical protein
MKKAFSILLLLALFSCGKRESTYLAGNPNYGTSLIKTDSILINLDAKTAYEFLNVSYFANDSLEILFQINNSINGFNIYDLNSAKLISQVSIPLNGPVSMLELQGATIKSLDSIYLFSKMNLRKILILDYQGNFKNSLRTKEFEPRVKSIRPVTVLNHQSSTNTPTILLDNKLIFTKFEIFDYNMPSNITDDYLAEFYLDLDNLEFSELPITFPKWLHNKSMHFYGMLHGKTVNDAGHIIYAFVAEDSIRAYDKEKKQFSSYLAKYDGDDKEKIFYTRAPNPATSLEDGLGMYLYTQIIYDKYRNVYYRILQRPIRYDPTKHKNYLAYYLKPTSCIILDSNFKKIGEFNFEIDVYRSYGSFVGKKGLYVPKLNGNYKNLDEDQVEYSIYSLKQN